MTLLLDTCTLVWLAQEPSRLSKVCRATIDDPQTDLLVSHATLWEMALKVGAGKLTFSPPLRRWLIEQQDIWKFDYLVISDDHILRTLEVERHHVDPFDRLLVTQALAENLPIATPDPLIARYPVQILW